MKDCVLECRDKNGEIWLVTSDGKMTLFDKNENSVAYDPLQKSLYPSEMVTLKVTGKYDLPEGQKASICLDEICWFSNIKSLFCENVTLNADGRKKTLPAHLETVTLYKVDGYDPSMVSNNKRVSVRGYNLPKESRRNR